MKPFKQFIIENNEQGLEPGDVVQITKPGLFSKYLGKVTRIIEIIPGTWNYATVEHPTHFKQTGEILTYNLKHLKLLFKKNESGDSIMNVLDI